MLVKNAHPVFQRTYWTILLRSGMLTFEEIHEYWENCSNAHTFKFFTLFCPASWYVVCLVSMRNICSCNRWRRKGGGTRDVPLGPIFIFMQNNRLVSPLLRLVPPVWEILDPPLISINMIPSTIFLMLFRSQYAELKKNQSVKALEHRVCNSVIYVCCAFLHNPTAIHHYLLSPSIV